MVPEKPTAVLVKMKTAEDAEDAESYIS